VGGKIIRLEGGYESHRSVNEYTNLPGIYQNFFPPSDSQLDSRKSNFKFPMKLTLKVSNLFRYKTPSSGSTPYLSLAKVTIVKMS
jgi:hypothetical protein